MNNRLKKFREALSKMDLDAAIISGRANTIYLSGFTGDTSFMLVGMDKVWLIVDFRFTIQAKEEAAKGIEIVEYKESFAQTINELLSQNKIEKVGVEGDKLTLTEYENFKEKLTKAKVLKNIGNILERIRMVKEEDEIERLQQAVLIGDRIFDHIIKFIKPGMKEYEIAAEMEYQMKKLGAKGPSFDTIVAGGPRSAMCHGTASDYAIKKGDALVLDFGVIYRNYCSDMTRTIFIGEPNDQLKKIYNIVRETQQKALDSLKSGMSGFDADKIARDIISEAGYGRNFGHSLGHGVGIEIHEEPRLSMKSKDILANGMVFSVEPGIYVEGLGGVRIEDMVVLVDNRPRNLTTSTKDMIII